MTFTVTRIRRRPGAPAVEPKKATPQVRPMSRVEIADAVAAIKDRQRRQRPPMTRYPEAYHEDKDEIGRMLERLEDAVRQNRPLKRV